MRQFRTEATDEESKMFGREKRKNKREHVGTMALEGLPPKTRGGILCAPEEALGGQEDSSVQE